MARTRTFIAVDLGAGIRKSAVAFQKALALCGADVNWVEAENLHVTLNFLGEVDDKELHAVCRAVKKAVAKAPPFKLRVNGLGAFPTPRRPKTLWAGITDGATDLAKLHGLIEGPLIEIGCYRREDRPYTPHLTLGRIKGETDSETIAQELPKHMAWDGGHTVIEQLLIFSSELRREGPTYSVVGRAALDGVMEI